MEAAQQYALSDGDIRRLLGRGIKIWNYPQLKDLHDANELFDKRGRAILLFPNSGPMSGHWTALFKRPKMIEFFDPYGDKPEAQKKGLGRNRLEEYDIERPDLTRLLRATGLPVYYNTHDFQRESPNVATCGRHSAVRLMYDDKDIDQYHEMIEKTGKTPDVFVVEETFNKLRK
jgi:hypothetical protein